MKKYLAYNGIDHEYEEFETIDDAHEWLAECFLDSDQGYHPNMTSCKIFLLHQTVSYDIVDSKKNYKYEYEDEIPDHDEISEAWPYDNLFDEIWKHKFVTVC